MKTISILGSGWLGLPLAEALVKQNYTVNASTRTKDRFDVIKATGATPFVVDIKQLDDTVDDFLEADILIVNITSKDIEAFTNLIGRIELSGIANVLFVSTTSVYKNTCRIVSEDGGDENADSPHYQIENLFRASKHFHTTVVRFAGLIGYNRHPGRFFGEREVPQPDAPVNMIHRDDCINLIGEIIRQSAWDEVFNACADTHPNKRSFYTRARESLGLPPPVFEESGDAQYKIVSNDKIKRALGYRFIHADLLKIYL